MKVFSSSQCRVVYGKVVSDLLNSLNSRSCKKLLLSVFFTFYILKFVLFFGRLSYFFRIPGIRVPSPQFSRRTSLPQKQTYLRWESDHSRSDWDWFFTLSHKHCIYLSVTTWYLSRRGSLPLTTCSIHGNNIPFENLRHQHQFLSRSIWSQPMRCNPHLTSNSL